MVQAVRESMPLARQRELQRHAAAGISPHLSVVIVNYWQWENTIALVRQWRRSAGLREGDVEVVVVDNHSPPHGLMGRLRRWAGVSLRRWSRNRGFARAVNEGCRLSRGQWFLLLNPDISVPPKFMDGVLTLAKQLEIQEPRAGIVGFRLQNGDGSLQLSSGRFPNFSSTLASLALPRSRRKYLPIKGEQRYDVPWVTGCCLLVKRSCWEDLGGLDERFFLYYEDVDLCRRARTRGWRVLFEPQLQAVHHGPLHSRPVPAAMRLILRHSFLTYASRHWAAWQFRLLAGLVHVEAWLRKAAAWWRGDAQAKTINQELARMVGDLIRQDAASARRRLHRVVGNHAQTLASPVRTPEAWTLAQQR